MLQYFVFPPVFTARDAGHLVSVALFSEMTWSDSGNNHIEQSITQDENTAIILQDEPQSIAITNRRLDHLNEAGCFCSGLGASSRHAQNNTLLLTMTCHSHSSPSNAELT